MADFRKLLLVLVAVALLASVASAQNTNPYSCNATAVPTLVRSEGIAELMGDILLNCSGVVPQQGIQANIRVKLTTNITSNPLSNSVTEGMLILDELTGVLIGYADAGDDPPTPYVDGTQTLFQGQLISDTEMEFDGVVLAAPGSPGAQNIRITNLRANVQALGNNATVYATINITGSTTVPVNNNQLVVADTRPGLIVTISPGDYKNCEDPSDEPWSISLKEGFASAFRPQGPDSPNSTPGAAFPNESGYTPPTLAGGELVDQSSIGMADQGTRFLVRLSDVPDGVGLSVSNSVWASGGNLEACVVPNADSDGAGGSYDCSGSTDVTDQIVYEVVDINALSLATQETLTIDVDISYDIPGPLGTAMGKVTFAPLSTVFTADSDAPEPRFIDNGEDQEVFTIGPCRTILLYPFVTAVPGWDTGLAVANTSQDPLETVPQTGACRFYLYGDVNGAPPPPNPQPTPDIAPGTVMAASLFGGGPLGVSAPGFQGYIIAICDFQFAHGYAFVSDLGVQNFAQGYIALIIPDRSGGRLPQDSSAWPSSNEGEGLSN